MKLYRVTLTTDVLVFAQDAQDAIGVAKREACDETKGVAYEYDGPLPKGWTKNTLVYQGRYGAPDLSVADIVKKATP